MKRDHTGSLPLILAVAYVLAGLIIAVCTNKGDGILFLNRWHSPPTDLAVYYLTDLGGALPYWIALIMLLFVRLRFGFSVAILGLLNMAMTGLLKVLWGNPRPYTWFNEAGLGDLLRPVELLELYDAYNSFPSGHTLAAFTLFTFLALIARATWMQVVCMVVACLVGISRIYLNMHFVEDVTFGAFCGSLLAWSGYVLQSRYLAGRRIWDASLIQLFKGER